jgi:hypothetical protein
MWIDTEEQRQVELALQERLKKLDKRDKATLARFENDFMGTGFSNNSNSGEASAA